MNRSNILGWATIGGLLAILALMPATASIFGDLLKANIYSNGGNVTLGQNSTSATGNIRVEDLVVEDDSTLTDDVAIGGDLTVTGATILTGGIATGTINNLTATTVTIGTILLPDADDGASIGSSTVEWTNLFLDGTGTMDALVADTADINGGTIDGAALGASTAITAITATTADINGGTIDGSTLGGAVQVIVTDADINGGTVDGVTIGAASPGLITGTTITVTTLLMPDADNGASIGTSSVEWTDLFLDGTGTMDALVADTADINAGSIDGATLGGAAQVTITDADINGGSLDGVPIGAASASTIAGTTIVGTTVTVNTVLLPDADNGASIGSATVEFTDLFLDGTGTMDALVADTADINAGTFDGIVGGTTPAAGSFTGITMTGPIVLGGNTAEVATTTTLASYGVSLLDTGDTPVYTLGDGTVSGEIKILVCTTAGGTGEVSVTHHLSSDPEEFQFDGAGEMLILIWDAVNTQWITVLNVGEVGAT